jgi:AcrR family transcriptional regulator
MTEHDERRDRILNVARDVFAQQGFRSAEVKTIAEQAGVGKATIYKFFDSKEHLLLTIVEENLREVRDLALGKLMAGGDPIRRLEDACAAMAGYVAANREFARVLLQEAGEFAGDIQRRHLSMVEENLPVAEAFFAELRKKGYFVAMDTRETLHLMLNLFIGSTYNWALTGEGDLEKRAVQYVRVLMAGLRTAPEEIEAR